MQKFETLTGVAAPFNIVNVDTDMIIPKQFLKTIKRTGLGKSLFHEMRYTQEGKEMPDFVLNRPAYRKAQILVAGDNFGCGSSREHAPWALLDFGIRCVISTSFADIFYNNCFKNGMLPIVVSPEELKKLMDDAERGANATLSIDLEARRSAGPTAADQVRDRPLPQALPAQRSRRHRPHNGEEDGDRQRSRRRPPRCGPGSEASAQLKTEISWLPTISCSCRATASAPKSMAEVEKIIDWFDRAGHRQIRDRARPGRRIGL